MSKKIPEHIDFSQFTKTAIEAALLGGDILRKGFGSRFNITSKEGKHNLVTEYDTRSERAILSFIQKKYPSHSFLAEESGSSEFLREFRWIIDPLDGTVNFAHEIPMFAVSIALEREGTLISAVVYHPILEELFVAEKGIGAFLNGNSLSVTSVKTLEDSFLSTGFPYNLRENPYRCIEHFSSILRTGIPIRRMGVASIDLSYVAAGRFDGFFEASLGPWDCAAGILLIDEAGGKTTQWNQDPFHIDSYKPILSTNSHIHEELSRKLCGKNEME